MFYCSSQLASNINIIIFTLLWLTHITVRAHTQKTVSLLSTKRCKTDDTSCPRFTHEHWCRRRGYTTCHTIGPHYMTLLQPHSCGEIRPHLIQRLKTSYGLSGMVLQWFQTYLVDRSQCVRTGLSASLLTLIVCGVPQGSVQFPPRCTKYNSPPINGQCTNHCIAI